MPDISMCKGKHCPLKESCHRYTAKPNEFRQSYFYEPPVNEAGECDLYWKTEPEKKMKPRLAGNLKPGVYQALLWPHNKEPHLVIVDDYRAQVATTGFGSLDFYTIFSGHHRLYEVRRLM